VGVWSQAVDFVFGEFGRNLASVAVKMFSHSVSILGNYK
jgi:hypothetical protein